jgi:HEAT repeat protein
MSPPVPEDVERTLAALATKTESERAAYLMELGWSRSGQPTPGLLSYLEDPALLVRMAAAQARWQTERKAEELEGLVEILVEGLASGDEELALTAGTALVNMEEAAVAPLLGAFQKRDAPQALIVRVLGEIGGKKAMIFLRQVAYASDPEAAAEAREALDALAEELDGG